MKLKSRSSLLAAVALAALALAACGDDGDESATTTTEASGASGPSVVTVEAVDDGQGGGYGFEVPASVPAGPTRLVLSNSGAEAHHAQLFMLNEGTTVAQVGEALASGDIGGLFAVGAFAGGTGTVDPGSSSSADAVVDLAAGTYMFMCFIEGAGGPHVAQGMVQAFEVTEADGDASLPTAAADVELVDFGFDFPEEVSGSDALTITNGSQAEIHEMNIVAPMEGVSTEDVLAYFGAEGGPSGPPPFSTVGGLQAIMPGASQTLQLGLNPGRYILICLVPSPSDGVAHAAKGMIQEVTIG